MNTCWCELEQGQSGGTPLHSGKENNPLIVAKYCLEMVCRENDRNIPEGCQQGCYPVAFGVLHGTDITIPTSSASFVACCHRSAKVVSASSCSLLVTFGLQ